MKVFVTGATGYVGSAVVQALVKHGHAVSGLSRSPEKDARVRELGAEPVRGKLGALAKVGDALRGFDAWIHAGIDYALGPPADREAVEALLAAAGQAGPASVVYTSGVWVLGETHDRADESSAVEHPPAAVAWRPAHERLVLDAATPSLATAVIRPGMVYGGRGGGLVSPWFEQAGAGGPQVVGSGENHWVFVHREDLGELYRLVVEKRARGVFHGVDGSPLTVKNAASAASSAVGGGAVRVVPLEEARKQTGPMADAMAMDQQVGTARAPEVGWKPRHRSFTASAGEAAREWKGA